MSSPETSTFAGQCTSAGSTDGHWLALAKFYQPKILEVNHMNSTVFAVDYPRRLRMIDLKADDVSTIYTFITNIFGMNLFGDNLLYFSQYYNVLALDLSTKEEHVIAGGTSGGDSIGPFELTRFRYVFGLLLEPDSKENTLLVADRSNHRFAGFSCLVL